MRGTSEAVYAATDNLVKPVDRTVTRADCAAERCREGAVRVRARDWAGLVGAAAYEGDLRPVWRYLVVGQWVRVGKGATFGLGSYRLEPDHAGKERDR